MTMNDGFKPENELEERLVALEQGTLQGDRFMDDLLSTQVFMPIFEKQQIAGFQADHSRPRPLVIEDEEGTQVLLLFSSPDRAKPIIKSFPGYEGGLLAEFHWVLGLVQPDWGISINPGWDVGIDLEADMVSRLVESQKEAKI